MSHILSVPGRAQLAGYAGLAGTMFRFRGRPLAIVAAVDVLAVALAFGALHIAGVIVGGTHRDALVPPAEASTEAAAEVTALVPPPLPRLAPAAVVAPVAPVVFAAMPDATVLFADPIVTGPGFTGGSRFTPPPVTVAEATPPPAAVDPQPDTTFTPPVAKIASIALVGRERALETTRAVTAPVIDTADGSLDRLLMFDVPATSVSLSSATNAGVSAGGATVDAGAMVTASADVSAPIVERVTQPVEQVVGKVASLLK